MQPSTPRETAIHWFESVWQSRSKEAVYKLMSPDAVAHQQGGGTTQGPAEFMGFHNQILSAFPHLSLRILRAVGDETQACVHWHVSTVKDAEVSETAEETGTGFTGMTFLTVKDGRITEGWDCWDRGTFMAALLRTNAAS